MSPSDQLMPMAGLVYLLQITAALQLGIALLNPAIPLFLGWRESLARLPLLAREVFQVHLWFISITVAIFSILTWRFNLEMAAGADGIYRWLAAAIGIFWAIRTALQVGYYSSSHWRGRPARTAIHVALLVVYGGFAAVYLTAAFRAAGGAS